MLDEHCERWDVQQGDPAYKACGHLMSLGFSNVVLPLAVLITGHRSPTLPWPSLARLEAADDSDFLHYARLYEQSGALDKAGICCYTGEEAAND